MVDIKNIDNKTLGMLKQVLSDEVYDFNDKHDKLGRFAKKDGSSGRSVVKNPETGKFGHFPGHLTTRPLKEDDDGNYYASRPEFDEDSYENFKNNVLAGEGGNKTRGGWAFETIAGHLIDLDKRYGAHSTENGGYDQGSSIPLQTLYREMMTDDERKSVLKKMKNFTEKIDKASDKAEKMAILKKASESLLPMLDRVHNREEKKSIAISERYKKQEREKKKQEEKVYAPIRKEKKKNEDLMSKIEGKYGVKQEELKKTKGYKYTNPGLSGVYEEYSGAYEDRNYINYLRVVRPLREAHGDKKYNAELRKEVLKPYIKKITEGLSKQEKKAISTYVNRITDYRVRHHWFPEEKSKKGRWRLD